MASLFKILLFLLLHTSVAWSAYSQSFKAQYLYDENGNRIKATVFYISEGSIKPKEAEKILIDEQINTFINVYPNPTNGLLQIEVVNAPSEAFSNESNSLLVWDVQGKIVMSKIIDEPSHSIDLTGMPNGVYFLKLLFNGKVNHFKVVKN